jgi:hypothetical protein
MMASTQSNNAGTIPKGYGLAFRRVSRIALGLLAQMLTAAAGFGIVGRLFSNEPHRNAMFNNPFGAAILYAIGFGMFYALYLLLPVIAFVMVCENRGYRDWRLYAAAGAAGTILQAAQVPFVSGYPIFILLTSLAGVLSGLCYWLIAGRFVGKYASTLPAVTPAKAGVP